MQDYRDLGRKVVADRLDASLQQRMVAAISNYTTGVLTSGQWDPKARAVTPYTRVAAGSPPNR